MNKFKEHVPEVANCYGTDYSACVPNCGPAKKDPFMKRYIKSSSKEEQGVMLLEWEAKGVIQGPANAVKQLQNQLANFISLPLLTDAFSIQERMKMSHLEQELVLGKMRWHMMKSYTI